MHPAVLRQRNDIPHDFIPIDNQLPDALGHTVRIFYCDMVLGAAEPSLRLETVPSLGDTRVDLEPLEGWLDAEDELGPRLVLDELIKKRENRPEQLEDPLAERIRELNEWNDGNTWNNKEL